MKILFFYFLLLSSVITPVAQPKLQEINAVLHDESYVAVHGHDDNHYKCVEPCFTEKMNCKKNALSFYSRPNYSNSFSMGFSFTRKI